MTGDLFLHSDKYRVHGYVVVMCSLLTSLSIKLYSGCTNCARPSDMFAKSRLPYILVGLEAYLFVWLGRIP